MKALLLVMVSSVVQAQTTTSLAQLLDASDTHNIDQHISVEQATRAQGELTQAWYALIPTLGLQAVWSHNQYEAVVSVPTGPTTVNKLTITPQDQFDGVLRIDVPLVDTTRWLRIQAATEVSAAAQERTALTRDLVHRQVVGTYYSVAASEAVLRSAEKSRTVAQAQLDLATTRVKTGVATELELVRARAELERTKQLIADATTAVAISRRNLRTLTGLEPGLIPELPNDDLHAEAPLQELEGKTSELPAIRAAGRDVAGAEKLALASRLTLVPLLGGQFTERISNATGFIGKAGAYNFGLTLSWRLDATLLQAMNVQQSAVNVAVMAQERARLQANDQLFSDWQRITSAIVKVQSAGAQVTAAQRAAVLAKERYEAGVATQIDVIQSERDVFAAEVGQITARTELASARASLRISTGQPIIP